MTTNEEDPEAAPQHDIKSAAAPEPPAQAGTGQSRRLPRSTPQRVASRLPTPVLWTLVASGWLIAAIELFATVLGFSWDWTPKLSIEATINPNPSNQVGTEFRITNIGRVDLTDLHFTCDAAQMSDGRGFLRAEDVPLERLPAGEPTTRTCGGSLTMENIYPPVTTIDFEVSFDALTIRSRRTVSKHFAVRRGVDSAFYAVPIYQPHPPAISYCLKSVVRIKC